MQPLAVFVDYDGTITDLDTFDVLVRHVAGAQRWARLDEALDRGELSLRDVLARQASSLHLSIEEADAYLERHVRFDPAFATFARACGAAGITLTIVSSGIAPLIRRMLARHDLADLPLVANEIDVDLRRGWRIRFRDPVPNGTDKAGIVLAARERGARTVFIGDGHSDFDAALAAESRYAKRGRSLERFLVERGVAFTPFSSFAEITLERIAA